MTDPEGRGADKSVQIRRGAKRATPQGGAPGDEPGPDYLEELPPECPVKPMGQNGLTFFYLSAGVALVPLNAEKHTHRNIDALFGVKSILLEKWWPRKQQNKDTGEWYVAGVRYENVQRALMRAAARKSTNWSPADLERGLGAWRGDNGELILHLGEELVVAPLPAAGEDPTLLTRPAGEYGRHVYPAHARIHGPASERQEGGPSGAGGKVFKILQGFNWRRGELDARLLLGWIGSAMLAGALDWRPFCWITGEPGTGKSTLHQIIRDLFGEKGSIHTSDATAAAVRQIGGKGSLPVLIDEAEAEREGRRVQALIRLARDAATGSNAIRGGQDHQATEFTSRSCFLFSSVIVPALSPQDRARVAILELGPIGDTAAPVVHAGKLGTLGKELLRRLVDNWPRWEDTLARYRETLAEEKWNARQQDVYGTLLAAADLLLTDHFPDSDSLAALREQVARHVSAELEEQVPDQVMCLNKIMTTLRQNNQTRVNQTLGEWLFVASGVGDAAEAAKHFIQQHGIKLHSQDGKRYLVVPNCHDQTANIFRDTHWAGKSDASGSWPQVLRRLGPDVIAGGPMWVGAGKSRTTLVPLSYCLPDKPSGALSEAEPSSSAAPESEINPPTPTSDHD